MKSTLERGDEIERDYYRLKAQELAAEPHEIRDVAERALRAKFLPPVEKKCTCGANGVKYNVDAPYRCTCDLTSLPADDVIEASEKAKSLLQYLGDECVIQWQGADGLVGYDRALAAINTALASASPPADAAGIVDRETVQTLLDLLNPLHGSLDKQTYDEKVKENFDAPRDFAYAVNVTAQQERDLMQAVCILENRLKAIPEPKADAARMHNWQIVYDWFVKNFSETNPETGEAFHAEAREAVKALCAMHPLDQPTDAAVKALADLTRDCMASDFNEHWESFKNAEAILAQLGHK